MVILKVFQIIKVTINILVDEVLYRKELTQSNNLAHDLQE